MNNGDMPAYPLDSETETQLFRGYGHTYSGLTKREAFAKDAPNEAVKAIAEEMLRDRKLDDPDVMAKTLYAEAAVAYADALIKALDGE